MARRPAPSSTSSPAATATSVASSSSIALQSAGRAEHGQRGRRPGDGGQVEDLADDGIEAVEAQADHRPDRLRQVAADGAVGVADQLGEEEGVAAGGGTQLGRARRRRARSSAAARRRSSVAQADRRARARAARRGRARRRPGRARASGRRRATAPCPRPSPDRAARDAGRARSSSATGRRPTGGRRGRSASGARTTRRAAARRPSRTGGSARRWDRGARTGLRARAARAPGGAAAAGRARRRSGAGPPGTPCAAPCAWPRPSARTGRSPRPSPGPTGRWRRARGPRRRSGRPAATCRPRPRRRGGRCGCRRRGWSTTGRAAGPAARRGRRTRRQPARTAGPGRATGDAGCGAGCCVRRSRSAVGRRRRRRPLRHRQRGAARLGSWLRIAVCSSDSSGVGSRPSSSASTARVRGVHAQRVGLAAAAVEGDHQAAGEPLAQRVLVGRALQLADGLAVTAEGEEGVEARLQRLQAQLVPAHRGRPGPLLVDDVGEGRTVPLGQPGLDVGRSAVLGSSSQRGAGLGDAVLEAGGVEDVAVDGQHVARPLPAQQLGVAERPAQQRDVALQRVHGRRRRFAGPHVVDQPVDGDDLPATSASRASTARCRGPPRDAGSPSRSAVIGPSSRMSSVAGALVLPVRLAPLHRAHSTASPPLSHWTRAATCAASDR